MRKGTALLGSAAALALVAGLGATAAPAQAKVTYAVSGSTVISTLPDILRQLGVAGVQFQGLDGAELVYTDGIIITLPAAQPVRRGVLPHTGVVTIAASLNRIDLAAAQIEYATEAGVTTGRITFQDAYNAVSGDRVTLFDIDNMSVKATKGKVVPSGKAWKRTDRLRITGEVSVVDDAEIVSALNTFIGTTWFVPGADFATLSSMVKVTLNCTTRKECA